jgi:hypothetical protein
VILEAHPTEHCLENLWLDEVSGGYLDAGLKGTCQWKDQYRLIYLLVMPQKFWKAYGLEREILQRLYTGVVCCSCVLVRLMLLAAEESTCTPPHWCRGYVVGEGIGPNTCQDPRPTDGSGADLSKESG